jgi:hypothetical protein
MSRNKKGVDLLLCIWWLSGLFPLQNITERESYNIVVKLSKVFSTRN